MIPGYTVEQYKKDIANDPTVAKMENAGMLLGMFLPGGGLGNLFKSKSVVQATEYTLTKTVAGNLATRPFLNSPLLVQEIMSTGTGVADASFAGGMNWVVQGTMNGSKGMYELGINPETKVIYHFLFKTIK